jgi:hypothetical protein
MHRRAVFCSVVILIGCISSALAREYLTEEFNGDFDLSFTTFTFKPDRSPNGYAVCKLPATEFPTPLIDGFTVSFFPWLKYVPEGVRLHGERYTTFNVNPNGSVTFGPTTGDTDGASLSNHFRFPRVSAWLGLRSTDASRPIYFVQLSNRVAITWPAHPDGANGGSNSVQLELFFDGVIRLTFLRMDITSGIVGLSRGGGVPADFSESNLSQSGCAGQALHELVWGATPSTVQPGQSFAASLSGRDAFNLSFPVNGPVRLGAGRRDSAVFNADFEQGDDGFTSAALSESPSNAWHRSTYRGTQLGHSPTHSMYFGDADTGATNLPSQGGVLLSPWIDLREVYPPITLSFAYLLSDIAPGLDVIEEGKMNSFPLPSVVFIVDPAWRQTSMDLSFYSGKRVRLRFRAEPTCCLPSSPTFLVDDIVITGTTNTVPVTPSLVTFTGDSWSGNVSIGAPGNNLVLIAMHSNGVHGLSAPINVGAADDLILSAVLKRTNVTVGGTNSIDILVSNTGPGIATSVVVTNELPPNVTLGNVAVSQGSFSVVGQRLLLNFGSIAGGGYVLASFEFRPTASGSLSITSTVAGAGGETFLGNNHVVNTINAGVPVVTVASAIASEGAGQMIFPLQLDGPSPQTITVSYTTVSSNAMAGEDFVPTNGVVTFPPGTTNAEARITIIDDNVLEVRPHNFEVPDSQNDDPERFLLRLTSATNAVIGIPEASGIIQENDPIPDILVLVTNAIEGNVGTNLIPVTFQITGPVAKPVDIDYTLWTGVHFHRQTSGTSIFGTASDGGDEVDFLPVSPSIILSPGQTQAVIYIGVIGDTRVEPNEFFTILTTSDFLRRKECCAPHPFYDTFTKVTIVDDEPPVFAINDYRIAAENCGTNSGALDPGETVTVQLGALNVGYNVCASANLSATLLPSGGVVNPSGPQNYGGMCGGGPEVFRPFTFTVGAACGDVLTATLSFSDNGTNLGTASLQIPVGRRARPILENFDMVTIPNLPPGWTEGGSSAHWTTANEPPGTNQFARNNTAPLSASTLASPGFVPNSTSVWLRVRHRYDMTLNAGGNLRLGTFGKFFSGSSRGWIVSQFEAGVSPGSTEKVSFELFRLDAATNALWEIDSVEVFDDAPVCCDGGAPIITFIRRRNNDVVLEWTAISNRSYQVQFKPSLNAGQSWNDLGSPVLATGARAARTNAMTSSNGFFRVRLN